MLARGIFIAFCRASLSVQHLVWSERGLLIICKRGACNGQFLLISLRLFLKIWEKGHIANVDWSCFLLSLRFGRLEVRVARCALFRLLHWLHSGLGVFGCNVVRC